MDAAVPWPRAPPALSLLVRSRELRPLGQRRKNTWAQRKAEHGLVFLATTRGERRPDLPL